MKRAPWKWNDQQQTGIYFFNLRVSPHRGTTMKHLLKSLLLLDKFLLELEMEMEMVFNGYSLTGFSITIYNDIIIINTKILTYNK